MYKLLVIMTAVVLSSTLFAQEDVENLSTNPTPRMDPSKHVRIVYNKFNTPDSMIFESLLDDFRSFYERHLDWDMADWVSTEMNMTYSRKIEAWVIAPNRPRRHSREDIQEFVDLLIDVANKSYETTLKAKRDLYCPAEKYKTMEQRFVALDRWYIDEHVDAEFYLNYTMENLDEQARADLRAWLNRNKQGFSSRRYNYRTLWAGRESELDANFARMCEAIEAY